MCGEKKRGGGRGGDSDSSKFVTNNSNYIRHFFSN